MISEIIETFIEIVEKRVNDFISVLLREIEDIKDDGDYFLIKTKNGWEKVRYNE